MSQYIPLFNGMSFSCCMFYPKFYGFAGAFSKVVAKAIFSKHIDLSKHRFYEESFANADYSGFLSTSNIQPLLDAADLTQNECFLCAQFKLSALNLARKKSVFPTHFGTLLINFYANSHFKIGFISGPSVAVFPCASFGRHDQQAPLVGLGMRKTLSMEVGSSPSREWAQTVASPKRLLQTLRSSYPKSWFV